MSCRYAQPYIPESALVEEAVVEGTLDADPLVGGPREEVAQQVDGVVGGTRVEPVQRVQLWLKQTPTHIITHYNQQQKS